MTPSRANYGEKKYITSPNNPFLIIIIIIIMLCYSVKYLVPKVPKVSLRYRIWKN